MGEAYSDWVRELLARTEREMMASIDKRLEEFMERSERGGRGIAGWGVSPGVAADVGDSEVLQDKEEVIEAGIVDMPEDKEDVVVNGDVIKEVEIDDKVTIGGWNDVVVSGVEDGLAMKEEEVVASAVEGVDVGSSDVMWDMEVVELKEKKREKEAPSAFLDCTSRATRGKRIRKLRDDEIEEDDNFWNRDALKEEENDNNYQEETELADVFDSDFDEDVIEPHEGAATKNPDAWKRPKGRLLFLDQLARNKEKKKKEKDLLKMESCSRDDLLRIPGRDAIRAGLQAILKPIKKKKEGEGKWMTQQVMLLEAVQTETINLRNLERVLARTGEINGTAIAQAVYTSPQVRYISKEEMSFLELTKGVSFVSEILSGSVAYSDLAMCTISGLSAKYRDPMTRLPCAAKEAFKIIRQHSLTESGCLRKEIFGDLLVDPEKLLMVTVASVLQEIGYEIQVPASINCRLREHQKEGVKFLCGLYAKNHGGVLGDGMSLGKTIQTIAFLDAICGKVGETVGSKGSTESRPQRRGPVLIMCPTSVILNWESEFSKWSSFMDCVYHGANRELIQEKLNAQGVEVLIASFDTYRIHGSVLSDVKWEIVVVVEAHRLKNEKSKLYAACLEIKTPRHIGLTGIVMQNKIMELFYLSDWVTLVCLGTREHFIEYYDEPLKRGQRSTAPEKFIHVADERKQHLGRILQNYMLRRTKEETIAHLMLGGEDNVVFCAMSKFQLDRAQHRMKQVADKHRSDRKFAVGDWVFVKLQPYKQHSVARRSYRKLFPLFYGPV